MILRGTAKLKISVDYNRLLYIEFEAERKDKVQSTC